MLGPAELRELDEALNEEKRAEGTRSVKTPYLTTHFAMGLAMTRAATAGLKTHSTGFQSKR